VSEPASEVIEPQRPPLAIAPAVPLRRPLFLQWVCIATASGLVLSALALGGFARGVSGAPLAVTLVIIGATVALAVFSGRLYWRADPVLARRRG